MTNYCEQAVLHCKSVINQPKKKIFILKCEVCLVEELMKEVYTIVDNEYERSSAEWGPYYNSSHEAIGVISEELEEVIEALNNIKAGLREYWKVIRSDADTHVKSVVLGRAKQASYELVAEAVQLSNTIQKAAISEVYKFSDGE